MPTKLQPLPVQSTADIRKFFDAAAADYQEQHGSSRRLLQYRLDLITRFACFRTDDTVLEIGCGPGNHLLPLSHLFGSAIGTDLSQKMVETARERARQFPQEKEIRFAVENGEELLSIADSSVTLVFCVGAFEHMVNKSAVLKNVFRVLKPGGRLLCLTPNGGYVWYRRLAPLLGLHTVRLSTDHFVSRDEVKNLLQKSGFSNPTFNWWTFVPKGDMPAWCGLLLHGLDWTGRIVGIPSWRGGLIFHAVKPGGAPAKIRI